MSDCLFCKIIAGEIPSAKVYEDELCYAFKDISPLAPMHFLVIPKQHFASAAEVTPENEAVVGHIYSVIAKLAKEQGFADGYRVVTNVGELAGQTVRILEVVPPLENVVDLVDVLEAFLAHTLDLLAGLLEALLPCGDALGLVLKPDVADRVGDLVGAHLPGLVDGGFFQNFTD